MNKYHQVLDKILTTGREQRNKKGSIRYLLDERLMLTPSDLLDIFECHNLARKKLRTELRANASNFSGFSRDIYYPIRL